MPIEPAIAWHAYFWDPWFVLWGGVFTVAMWRSRAVPAAVAGSPLSSS